MIKNLTAACAAIPMLVACAGGASEGEFVEACLKGGSQEMATTEICQCGAREAHARLSAQHFHAMVLDMQGKKQEAEQLLGDLSFDDRAKFAMEQFEVLGACLNGK
jgi:hypothetical protein